MPPDYSGKNLRGRSFKGQNLTGANFSKADIRGTNFTNAILKNADFTGSKAGLQRRWTIGLLIVLWLLSALLGILSIFLGGSVASIFYPRNFITGIVFLILLPVFCIITLRKGLTAGLEAFAGAFALAFAVVFAIVVVALNTIIGIDTIITLATSATRAFAGAFVLAGGGAAVFAAAVACAGACAGACAVAFAVAFAVDFVFKNAVFLINAFGEGITTGFAYAKAATIATTTAVAFAFTLFSAYIGWRSIAGNEKEAWVCSFAIAFAAMGGTSFRGADLTDVDFTGAILKNTDFRNANLTRTRFYEAKKLDLARVGGTILINRDVLNLLISCNGRKKLYLGANLKGANLIGADLKEANLKDADISEATFQGACLEWANLTLAQAVGTNFTSAQMTSACVEAWNIESSTQLNNVDCRFIYLLEYPKPETDDRERRPSSGEFQPGEFTKLFEEVLNTVDVIFRNGINWKAFVDAFHNVQNQNEDTEFALQAIENKGDGVIVVKIGVPAGADKEKIHSDFTQNYQLVLQAVEEKYKVKLQAKDNEIAIYRQQSAEMKEIVSLLANKPINVQVDNKVENKNMTNSNDSSRNIQVGNIGRDFNASGQALNLGEISGTLTNTINELPASPEPDKPGIKELLTQLQAAIEADKNLLQEDKAEALEQIKALAEAGKNPQEGAMQKAAKTAIKLLKGTIASLPSATKLVEECSNLLPLISNFLGLG